MRLVFLLTTKASCLDPDEAAGALTILTRRETEGGLGRGGPAGDMDMRGRSKDGCCVRSDNTLGSRTCGLCCVALACFAGSGVAAGSRPTPRAVRSEALKKEMDAADAHAKRHDRITD